MLDESLPTAAAARIDSVCQEFEAALQQGGCPDIEGYVKKADSGDHELLRRELQRIRSDFAQAPQSPPANSAEILSPPAPISVPFRGGPWRTEESSESAATESFPSPAARPDAPNTAAEVLSFDRYRVRGVLGKGGFGLVYRGYDPQLDREVAIKVPIGSQEASQSQRDAYINEARVVAGLDHPGIVPVYDVGRTGGQCFVVSKYVAGSDLTNWMKRQRPGARLAAELVLRVAEALHHAHQRGVVHRDIKPSNILMDQSGQPLLADFGLALRDDAFGRGTGFCGTPDYMSPEQATGKSHRVDARSDIYSLGVVFYELLTGRRPYRRTERDDVIDEIATGDIRPPRQLDHSIPKELEGICLKALAKRVDDRYTTAYDLAEELRCYLLGRDQSGNDLADEQTPASAAAGRRKLGVGLAVALLAICGLALAGNVLLNNKRDVRFEALDLKVSLGHGARELDAHEETYALVRDGQDCDALPDDRLESDESFRLEGSFEAPCFWRLAWLDTRGHWSAAAAPTNKRQQFFYPLNRKTVAVSPDDPAGTHLLVIIASDEPIGEKVLAHLSATPPPMLERLRFWSNCEAATARGPGREFETIDSYVASLAAQLPENQRLAAVLFLPVGP